MKQITNIVLVPTLRVRWSSTSTLQYRTHLHAVTPMQSTRTISLFPVFRILPPPPHSVNVKLYLVCFLTEHYAMKAYWGVDEYLHTFFDLGTRWR